METKTFYGYDLDEICEQINEYAIEKAKETGYKVNATIDLKAEGLRGKYAIVTFHTMIPTKTIQKSIVFRFNGRLCDPDVDTQYNKFFDNKDRKVIDYQFAGKELFVRYEETIYEEEN